MPEVAAAAELGHGAFPGDPVGGLFNDLHDLTGGPGLLGFLDANLHGFTGHGIGDEHGAALNMGHTLTFRGVIGDDRFVNLIFG